MKSLALSVSWISGSLVAAALLAPPSAARVQQPSPGGLREAYEAARHEVRPDGDGYVAWNPGQAWHTRFDGRGARTTPAQGGWSWGLALRRYGFAGSERELGAPASVRAEGARVVYGWDDVLTETYENESGGLENGFTLDHRPAGSGAGPLLLELAVQGDLRAVVEAGGRDVRFVDARGAAALTYSGLLVRDARGRELAAGFQVDGDTLRLSIDDEGACYPLEIDPIAQQAYLKASNTGKDDYFGWSAALSGDTAVVGAPYEASSATGVNGDGSNDNTPFSGAAYVFVRSGTTWSQQAYLKASNTGGMDEFGWSVAIDGDTIVVGARWESSDARTVNGAENNDNRFESGAVYVFVRSGTTWSQQAYLKAANADEYDWFGTSVTIDGDTIVVGAPGEAGGSSLVNGPYNNALSVAGAAYVFVRSGTTWTQQAYVKASDPQSIAYFGISLALEGNRLVVGAFNESSSSTGVNSVPNMSAPSAGAAYVYERTMAGWQFDAYLKASNTDPLDYFGSSVAVSGDTIAVGAQREQSNASGVNGNQSDNSYQLAGAAYVFVRNGTSWSQKAYLKPFHTLRQAEFGTSIALVGDRLVVGAVNDRGGTAYLYYRAGEGWYPLAELRASNAEIGDGLGSGVAISGDTILAGAFGEDSAATGVNGNESDNSVKSSGAAYPFLAPLAGATVRAGSPANPVALLVGSGPGPVIGGTWHPSVDHASFYPSAAVDVLTIDEGAPLNVPTRFGTLLCDPSLPVQTLLSPAGVPFAVAIPLDPTLIGTGLCSQAASTSATSALANLRLTNALDLVVGLD